MACSQPDPLEIDAPTPVASSSTSTPLSTQCRRCDGTPSIFLRAGAYCSTCFDAYVEHKFKRASEGARSYSRTGHSLDHPSARIKLRHSGKRSKILLALSGGKASRVMLDLATSWFPKRAPQSRAPEAFQGLVVVHVEESELPGGGPDISADLRSLVQQLGFEFISIPFSSIYSTSSFQDTSSSTTHTDRLVHLLSPPPSASIKSDPSSLASLHRSLLHTLLRRTAVEHGCEILLTGETANRVASLTLSGMAEGRGWAIGEEVGIEWEALLSEGDAERSVLVARPISSLLDVEVEHYVRAHALQVFKERKVGLTNEWEGGEVRKGSIMGLTRAFVEGLEQEFPSTVQTVLRTVQKLGMRSTNRRVENGGAEVMTCAVCGVPAQEGAAEWREAITISAFERNERAKQDTPSDDQDLEPHVCYGCLLVTRSVPIEVLPDYVQQAKGRRREQDVIRVRKVGPKEIQEVAKKFLLE